MANQQPSLIGEKRNCKKCGETKPINDFPVSDAKRGYRRHICNICESQRKKDYYGDHYTETREKQNKNAKLKYNSDLESHRSQGAEWARHYREIYREKVFNFYGNKCACCGETERVFLTIDHKNNDGYTARKEKLHPRDSAGFYRWLVKHDFPAEFQILCMNCNFGKSRNNGICPHEKGSTTISKESTAKRLEVPSSQVG